MMVKMDVPIFDNEESLQSKEPSNYEIWNLYKNSNFWNSMTNVKPLLEKKKKSPKNSTQIAFAPPS